MPSLLQCSIVGALASSAAARLFGAVPSQTVGGYGQPIFEAMPTEAPSMELVKRKLEKKALTNVCEEWTILGGNGKPQCYNSQTCLFSSVGAVNYEGCGLTSVRYDWITDCVDYPNSGTAGPSQTFCDATYPACGTFEFVFQPGYTFSNFGCATKSYSYVATYLSSENSLTVAGSGTTIITIAPTTATVYVTQPQTNTGGTGGLGGGISTGSSTPLPQPVVAKSKPTGAIVGGVLGGVAVIAFVAFLAWFCLRKRRQDKAAAAEAHQQQADAATAVAYHATHHTAEMDGTMSQKPGAGAFAPVNAGYSPPSEKPVAGVAANEYRPQPQSQYSNGYGNDPSGLRSVTGSPPPIYGQSPTQQQSVSSPSSQYTELDPTQTARQSGIPPTSPAGTHPGHLSSNASELGATENRTSYQAYNPSQHQTPVPGMNTSTGGINRPAVGRQQPGVDMSGAPMSDNFRPQELP